MRLKHNPIRTGSDSEHNKPSMICRTRPRRANLKPPGKCIFCGGHGLTKEHMWADWLRAYIPRAATEHHTQSKVVYLEKDETSLHRRTGDPHSRRIRCVCLSCNNGWMSELQEDAKPFLVPMLKGERITLHRRAQTILASWIGMTVIVAEHVDQENVGAATHPYPQTSAAGPSVF